MSYIISCSTLASPSLCLSSSTPLPPPCPGCCLLMSTAPTVLLSPSCRFGCPRCHCSHNYLLRCLCRSHCSCLLVPSGPSEVPASLRSAALPVGDKAAYIGPRPVHLRWDSALYKRNAIYFDLNRFKSLVSLVLT